MIKFALEIIGIVVAANLATTLCSAGAVDGGQGANDALRSKQQQTKKMGGALILAGGGAMALGIKLMHSPPTAVVGGVIFTTGMTIAMQGLNRLQEAKGITYKPIENTTDTTPGCTESWCQSTPPPPDTSGNNPTPPDTKPPVAKVPDTTPNDKNNIVGDLPTVTTNSTGVGDPLDILLNHDIKKVAELAASEGYDLKNPADVKRAMADSGNTSPSSLNDMLSKVPGIQDEIRKIQEQAMARYNVSGIETEGGSGGGGSSRRSIASDPGISLDFGSLFGKKAVDHASTDFNSMNKNYNGDPVGIAQSNIFQQVHNRYVTKQRGGDFISESAPGLNGRVPNAVHPPLLKKRK